MSDSSIQILKKENELIKTAQNNCYGKNEHETNDFRVVVINMQSTTSNGETWSCGTSPRLP